MKCLLFRYLDYVIRLVERLLFFGVRPVLVFDGKPPPLKERLNCERKRYVFLISCNIIFLPESSYLVCVWSFTFYTPNHKTNAPLKSSKLLMHNWLLTRKFSENKKSIKCDLCLYANHMGYHTGVWATVHIFPGLLIKYQGAF